MTKAIKKAATKKATSVKRKLGIKYADKSACQSEQVAIFNKIKKLLLVYGKGNIKVRSNDGGQVTLVSEKLVEIQGKKREEIWFAAALVQKGYVGFYFMPVNNDAEKNEVFKPALLKYLKGKSCFHIKKPDAEIFELIEQALAKGYRKYKERGWV
jgi:hypothetical protein